MPSCPIYLAAVPDAVSWDEPFSVIVIFEPTDSARLNAPLPETVKVELLFSVIVPLGRFKVLLPFQRRKNWPR